MEKRTRKLEHAEQLLGSLASDPICEAVRSAAAGLVTIVISELIEQGSVDTVSTAKIMGIHRSQLSRLRHRATRLVSSTAGEGNLRDVSITRVSLHECGRLDRAGDDVLGCTAQT